MVKAYYSAYIHPVSELVDRGHNRMVDCIHLLVDGMNVRILAQLLDKRQVKQTGGVSLRVFQVILGHKRALMICARHLSVHGDGNTFLLCWTVEHEYYFGKWVRFKT